MLTLREARLSGVSLSKIKGSPGNLATYCDHDLVVWLDAHNADPEERNDEGLTAFHISLRNGHQKIVTYFCNAFPPKGYHSKPIYTPPLHKVSRDIYLSDVLGTTEDIGVFELHLFWRNQVSLKFTKSETPKRPASVHEELALEDWLGDLDLELGEGTGG